MKNILRKVGIFLGVVVGLILVALSGLYLNSTRQMNQTYEFPAETITIPTDEQSIAAGKKWVTANCTGCHGADLSGTTMINDPAIGHVDSANLTSGKGGIASTYTDADWVRALRHGVDPTGKPLLIMPSSAFWSFSDEDLGEVIAYLKTIPPVDHETTIKLGFVGTIIVPTDPNSLHVKLIDHENRPANPVVGVTTEYGEYLVNVSGCRDCHGNNLSGKPAANGRPVMPNITPGGQLQFWSEDEFITIIRTGTTPGGQELDPKEMPWKEYSNYSDEELRAIYQYLYSLPALSTFSE